MKRVIRIVLPFALAFALALPGTALAAGNTTDVEQKWIDFQSAVTDQMVKDGVMTRQNADARIAELKKKLAESDGDSIYQFFMQQNKRADGCKDGKCGDKGRAGMKTARDDAAFRVYSLITGKSEDELRKTCEAKGLTIWMLAGQEGKLQALKDRLLAGHSAGLDAMVKSGVMTEQQRAKIIAHMKEELDKK